jgi:hypothetical protein
MPAIFSAVFPFRYFKAFRFGPRGGESPRCETRSFDTRAYHTLIRF